MEDDEVFGMERVMKNGVKGGLEGFLLICGWNEDG